MVIRSLNVKKNSFRSREENEEVFDPEVPYISVIGAFMYLTNCTRLNIAFATNLLVRFSSSSIWRHWNDVKHVFRYLRRTTNFGLFYSKGSKQEITGYTDASYLSDPIKTRSQIGYVFTRGGTAIS